MRSAPHRAILKPWIDQRLDDLKHGPLHDAMLDVLNHERSRSPPWPLRYFADVFVATLRLVLLMLQFILQAAQVRPNSVLWNIGVPLTVRPGSFATMLDQMIPS